jgi:hypothetical protein
MRRRTELMFQVVTVRRMEIVALRSGRARKKPGDFLNHAPLRDGSPYCTRWSNGP